MWPGQNDNFFPSASLKKRKRDTAQADHPHSINRWAWFTGSGRIISLRTSVNLPITWFSISTKKTTPQVHGLYTSFHMSYTDPSKHCDNECSSHIQYLNRKWQALQQPSFYSQHTTRTLFTQQFYSDATQHKIVSQPICLPTNMNISPPPLFPRTSASRSSQQTFCVSASFLRSCHICHRRPTTRELLEAYADCNLCGQRACFICLRQCDVADCCIRAGQDQTNQELWRGSPDNPQWQTDVSILKDSMFKRICSCCTVEWITETGMEVVQCLACIG